MNFQKEADIFSKSASGRRQSDHDHFVEKVSNIQKDPGLHLLHLNLFWNGQKFIKKCFELFILAYLTSVDVGD
jgi:hypothetical protein